MYNYFMSRINRFVRDIETSTNMLLETFGEMERSGITPEMHGASPAAVAQAVAKANAAKQEKANAANQDKDA
jgi:hypothetical protein